VTPAAFAFSNHESIDPDFYDGLANTPKLAGESRNYFSFDWGPVHVAVLDSFEGDHSTFSGKAPKVTDEQAAAGFGAEIAYYLDHHLDGADPELVNFLELLIEKNRMTEIFRVRRQFEQLWKLENKRIDVTVTSAVELESAVVEKIGEEIERQTGRKVELASRVDDEILGGIVLQVGNMVLDASIRSRLEKLRKSVAQAA